MADDLTEEIIPWHFYSTRVNTDADLLKQVNDQRDLERRITARKGWITKALDRVKADKAYHEQFKLKGKEQHARYIDTKNYLEERMAMVVNAFRRILQVVVLDKQTFFNQFDEIAKRYYEGMDTLGVLITQSDPNPTPQSTPAGAQVQSKGLSKGTLDTLKPQSIDEKSLPHTLFDFSERLKIYMNANGIFQLPFPEQRQIARSFMSTELWNLIRDRITPNMPVFMDTDAENYFEGDENSVIEVLQKEFRRLHPTVTRRLALIKKSQRAEQSSLAFLSEVKRDALSANLRDVDEQALTCMILINGLSSEELRSELLDLFEVDQDLSLATIEAGIRKYEANKRTTTYVQGRKSSDVFQVSNYKKGQRQARREYAQANYHCKKCDADGHTSSRCPSNGLERGSSQSSRDDSPDSYDGNKGQKGRKSNHSKNHLNTLTQVESFSQDEPEVDEDGELVHYVRNLVYPNQSD